MSKNKHTVQRKRNRTRLLYWNSQNYQFLEECTVKHSDVLKPTKLAKIRRWAIPNRRKNELWAVLAEGNRGQWPRWRGIWSNHRVTGLPGPSLSPGYLGQRTFHTGTERSTWQGFQGGLVYGSRIWRPLRPNTSKSARTHTLDRRAAQSHSQVSYTWWVEKET